MLINICKLQSTNTTNLHCQTNIQRPYNQPRVGIGAAARNHWRTASELVDDGVGAAVGSDCSASGSCWRTESRPRWGATGGVGELLEDGVEAAVGTDWWRRGTAGGRSRGCGGERLTASGNCWRTESGLRRGAAGVGELLEDGVGSAVGSSVGVGELLEDGIRAAVGSC
ncbi:hypothetical protein MLD38_006965 [Melastoma candidum]|uniref:Uncharacterized protein n=1 Tax=Melastoma candidum TaxID=119954 RepID=A0ACB9RPK7_9MYRT|nr:hypothetical protein MLD38_006965 [Melastoma candidum]